MDATTSIMITPRKISWGTVLRFLRGDLSWWEKIREACWLRKKYLFGLPTFAMIATIASHFLLPQYDARVILMVEDKSSSSLAGLGKIGKMGSDDLGDSVIFYLKS